MREYETRYLDPSDTKELKYVVQISFGKEKLEDCIKRILEDISSKAELDIMQEQIVK